MESRSVRQRTKKKRFTRRPARACPAVWKRDAAAPYRMVRIESTRGEPERWVVKVVPPDGGADRTTSVRDRGFELASTGGLDSALAAWDALCSLEQVLREARGRRAIRHPSERFDPEPG